MPTREEVARAIGSTYLDGNGGYGLRLRLSWDEQLRAADAILALMQPDEAMVEVAQFRKQLHALRDSQIEEGAGPTDPLREPYVLVPLDALAPVLVGGHDTIARIEALEAAAKPFAGIKADDGDDFSTYPDEVVIRCEVTVGEIKALRACLTAALKEGASQ